jgi:meso-butanediol dehydrogenase / (S,S)-butanediol dehydrogenase / diacetyl reductase
MELKGSVAIVTGGARGIGRGIAYELAAEGARIVIADLPGVSAERDETVGEIKKRGGEAVAVDCDVRDFAQAQAMVQQAIDAFGQVDVLVNNAGVIRIGPVVAFAEDDWDLIMDVNVKGTFLCSKAVIPHMTGRRSGKIVNVSSIAGKRGRPFASSYASSKWAVIGFTQSLAYELAPSNVNVNAICPGEVDTHMWQDVILPMAAAAASQSKQEAWEAMLKRDVPLARPQTPQDMGRAVVYLCREDNITGVALNISGGTEMH